MLLEALSPIQYDAGPDGIAQTSTQFELADEHARPLSEMSAVREVKAQKAAPMQEKEPAKPSTLLTPDKPLEKMNRDELDEYARKVRIEGDLERFDTKAALFEATKSHAA